MKKLTLSCTRKYTKNPYYDLLNKHYIRINKFSVLINTQEVHEQVFRTLYEYPQLGGCVGLLRYISDTVRLAWALNVQNPPFLLDFDKRTFSSDQHSRFFTSDSDSSVIKSHVWPGLREGENGPIVCKGIVIT